MGIHQDRFREAEKKMLKAQKSYCEAEAAMDEAIEVCRRADEALSDKMSALEDLRVAAVLEEISERAETSRRSKQRI